MKRISKALALVAVMLVLVGSLGLLSASRGAFSTPEDVAEGFVRTLVSGDYDDALEYLDRRTNKDIDTTDLRHFATFIAMRSGQVNDIRGVRRWVRGRRAEASAMLVTNGGNDWSLNLVMVRKQGTWSIAEIGSIENVSVAPNSFGIRVPAPIVSVSPDANDEQPELSHG